jgi:hypothetical protein
MTDESNIIASQREASLSAHCRDGEDIMFLAACALSGNYDLVSSGVVRPEYVRPMVAPIIHWLLDSRATPTLEELRFQFDYLEWPTVTPGTGVNLDPGIFCAQVLDSYRRYLTMELTLLTIENENTMTATDEHPRWIAKARDLLTKVEHLGSPTEKPDRFGANPDALLETLLGTGVVGSVVSTPWEHLNGLIGMYWPGLYGFYSRPKQGKSLLLDDIAVYNGIIRGLPGIIVDPENADFVLSARLACAYSKLNMSDWDRLTYQLILNRSPDTRPEDVVKTTEYQEMMIARMSAALQDMSKKSSLFVVSRDKFAKAPGGYSLEMLLDYARQVGAKWICIDQLQKMTSPSIRAGVKDHERIGRLAQILANQSEFVVFASTQENREGESAKNHETTWHSPSTRTVAQSDGLAQNAMFLAHVRMFSLTEGFQYEDDLNVPRIANHVQCVWPLVLRNGRTVTIENRFFRLLDLYTYERILSNMEGYALVERDMAGKRELYKQEEARKKGRSGGAAGAPSDQDRAVMAIKQAIHSPVRRVGAATPKALE